MAAKMPSRSVGYPHLINIQELRQHVVYETLDGRVLDFVHDTYAEVAYGVAVRPLQDRLFGLRGEDPTPL